MTTLTIPDVQEEVIRHWQERARQHHRSLEAEVRMCLESDVKRTPEEVDRILEEIGALRESFTETEMTDEFLEKAKNWGRP